MATDGGADAADEENPLVGVLTGAVTFLTLGVAFALMFLGVDYFWVAFPVGFGGGMPLAAALAKYYGSERADDRERGRGRRDRSDGTDDALAELRDRYARGEIDDAEFETRVERLLETESVDDAETFLAESDGEDDRSTERDAA
ncbi:SHOCT domain-containing protein [Halosimplex pelagicum]|uniref:SHOCT domain-containing protein n=1 Tax=Halosimplex pelagicum TaxID=869886 RepID=A0A7D5T502_9EURY|nr:SHOCT domain-containing protein [Halosimplex pelagicum]QLH81908.1 SHOCT domain-containing protein [Halosimplex pelagicum]